MSGPQALRILAFLVLPLASAVAVLAARRASVAPAGRRGRALRYGPVIGAGSALAPFVGVLAVSVLSGH